MTQRCSICGVCGWTAWLFLRLVPAPDGQACVTLCRRCRRQVDEAAKCELGVRDLAYNPRELSIGE